MKVYLFPKCKRQMNQNSRKEKNIEKCKVIHQKSEKKKYIYSSLCEKSHFYTFDLSQRTVFCIMKLKFYVLFVERILI